MRAFSFVIKELIWPSFSIYMRAKVVNNDQICISIKESRNVIIVAMNFELYALKALIYES